MESNLTSEILKAHTSYVRSVAFNHDGTMIVSGSGDNTIRVWDVSTGVCLSTLKGHTGDINSVAFNHDGTKIVSASGDFFDFSNRGDNTVRVWNVSTGVCLSTLKGHTRSVNSVAFNHDGTKVVSASSDKTIRVWNVTTGECLSTLKGHTSSINSVAFNADDTKIVSASNDKTIRVWNVSSEVTVLIIKNIASTYIDDQASEDGFNSVALSPDGTKIVSASGVTIFEESRSIWGPDVIENNNAIRIWDISTGECLSTLKGHTSSVNSVAFNHDGTKIVSGSNDETTRIWDVSTGVCLSTLKTLHAYVRHTNLGAVNSVAFNHDGTKIVSALRDNTIRLWDVFILRYKFTENLYTDETIQWLKANEIEYTVDTKGDTLIFHVSRKFHPLFLDITVSSQGFKVERPGNLLLEDMITKKACNRIRRQGYETIEDLMVDLYRSFQYSKKTKKYRQLIKNLKKLKF